MSRRVRLIVGLVLLATASCDRGSGKPPGLEGAEPLVAEFARAAKALDDIAAAIATRPAGDGLPAPVDGDMTRLGEAARAVLRAAEPDGSGGAPALSAAVAGAANDVVRHLVTTAGGRAEGPGRMALGPPAALAFVVDATVPPAPDDSPGRNRTERGKIEARGLLRDGLRGEIVHFAYVALLVNPATRSALAPRLSPDDLPAEVPNRNLPVANRDEWRQQLFDDSSRLVVPGPFDPVRWVSFLGWVEAVNAELGVAVHQVTEPALDLVFVK